MKILVINAGSSSLKYQLIDMNGEKVLAKGNCERIGVDGLITHKTADGRSIVDERPFPSHKEAFLAVIEMLTTGEGKVIDDMKEISAIGHRVLHGSEVYKESTFVTDKVIEDIAAFKDLGPLHNPPQAVAMKACQDVFGKETPMVAVFDTSFHQTMPEKAYIFGIPYEYYEKYHIRRYGFHGTSHRYVSMRYGQLKGPGKKIVTCHLGNGSSIAAIEDGKCMDTSMGFTPLDGLIMGTRSGGIDPSVVTFLADKENLSPSQMSDLLNKKSGFLGISGLSSDARDLVSASHEGHKRARLACEIVRYQVKKFIGSYAAALCGIDAVVFTGGIGENSGELREEICEGLDFLGITLDKALNTATQGVEKLISTGKTEVWVIPTNEELLIARDTMEHMSK